MRACDPGAMDRPVLPTPDGFRLALDVSGEACSWRLTTPEGAPVAGLAPDPNAARRAAAFAASVVAALHRTRQRRF
jgi:hypothetical protein